MLMFRVFNALQRRLLLKHRKLFFGPPDVQNPVSIIYSLIPQHVRLRQVSCRRVIFGFDACTNQL